MTSSGPTRRTVTKVAAGAAAVALAAGPIHVLSWLNQPRAADLAVLSQAEYDIVQAVAEAMFPPNSGLPMSGSEANVGLHLDRQLEWFSPDTGRMLRVLLHLIDESAVAFDARLTPFAWRPLDERVAILEAWDTSPVMVRRLAFTSIKLFIAMHYHENTDVLQRLGASA